METRCLQSGTPRTGPRRRRISASRQNRMRNTVDAVSPVTERHDDRRPFRWVPLGPMVGSRAVEAPDGSPTVSSSVCATLRTFGCTWLCTLTRTPTAARVVDRAARLCSVRAVPAGQGRPRRRFALGCAHPGQSVPPLDLAGNRAAPPLWGPPPGQEPYGWGDPLSRCGVTPEQGVVTFKALAAVA